MFRQQFLQLYHEHQIVLVLGDDGFGKSSQIPQWILFDEYPDPSGSEIACIQPSCDAAISLAKQVAAEVDVSVGELVGYSTLFQDKISPSTRLKFMSARTLFRETYPIDNLKKYSCIILDETQEETVWTDLLLATLKWKVIPTCTTISFS
jgi:pre-mRNA-splicing factor ATP-dependent RNA helicase DHX15/PRP43